MPHHASSSPWPARPRLVACLLASALGVGVAGVSISPASAATGRAGGNGAGQSDESLRVTAERRFPQFKGMPDARSAAAPVLLHGRVTDDSGSAVAGAEILLASLPRHDVRSAMPEGATYSIRPVARTASDAEGYYVLRASNTPELRANTDELGVNLELDVFTPAGRHLVFTSEARFDAASNGWTQPGAKATDKVSAERTAGNRRNIQVTQGEGSDTSNDVDVAAPVEARNHHSWPGCSEWRVLPKKDTVNTIATGIVRNGVSMGARYNAAATSEK